MRGAKEPKKERRAVRAILIQNIFEEKAGTFEADDQQLEGILSKNEALTMFTLVLDRPTDSITE